MYKSSAKEVLFESGGGVLRYISQIGMFRPKGKGFSAVLFGLKTGIDFAHLGLESVVVYEGTTVMYQCVRRFNSKSIRKKV